MISIKNSIISDLKNIIAGEVINTPESITEFSQDFGRIIKKKPLSIVRPQSSQDVAQVIEYAVHNDLTVCPRAGGYSLGGQCLNQDGIILDMRSLNRIHEINPDQLYFQADAGASWRKVVESSMLHSLIPPVLTNFIDVTVGGTHAAGGIGVSSFRYGTQADNCLELEVVTGDGEIIWCNPKENSELFNHVLCGYGQFGIITQVRHKLQLHRPYTRTYYLTYDNLDALLKDKQTLTSENRIDYLLSVPSPALELFSKAKSKPLIQWFYVLQITIEVDELNANNNDEKILADLNYYRRTYTEDTSYGDFVLPALGMNLPENTVHPWVDLIIPESQAKTYIETALSRLPAVLDCGNTLIGSFCLPLHTTKIPMFCRPNEDTIGLGIYPIIPEFQLQPVLSELKYLTDLALECGGKRYLSGWVDFDLQQWRSQFGNYWSKVNEIKHKYDPKGIFNSGFFKYESVL
ncbi:FAD-binding protein [Nostoc sp. CHAB 5836]|uniref:FAD-binding protein n=1 Tax=Nostoc sp. CHAB 5836 TaxID=2780404 RepID=UPI001E3C27AC|nr:FAD-binding protein [Nostoc sp. CHAB 5836]MCC5618139.1 FAD-binding protein [Nostoc sp. CHAB 5836]